MVEVVKWNGVGLTARNQAERWMVKVRRQRGGGRRKGVKDGSLKG